MTRGFDVSFRRALAGTAAVLLGATGAVAIATPATAAIIPVLNVGDVGADTLRAAITAAESTPGPDEITFLESLGGGTITLASDLPTLSESVTITGPTGGITIDADDTATNGIKVFGSSGTPDISVSNISIVDALGSGIRSQIANLTLTNVSSDSNTEYGLSASAGTFTIEDSQFNENGVDGVNIGDSPEMTIIGSTANDNGESGFQPQTVVGGATVTIAGSTANDNGTDGFTLNLYDSSTAEVTDSSASGNTVSAYHSSLFDSQLELTRFTAASSATQSNIIIAANGANSLATLTDVVTTDAVLGGGVALQGNGGEIIVDGVVTEGNELAGAFVSGSDVTFTLDDVTSHDNGSIGGVSGGINFFLYQGSEASLTGALVSENRSSAGGGIRAQVVNSTLAITNSTIADNTAAGNGGGVAVVQLDGLNARMSINDSVVRGNSAAAGGGVAAIDINSGAGSLGLAIVRTTIDENTAGLGAGGVHITQFSEGEGGAPAVLVDRSTISSNIAPTDGAIGIFGFDGTGLIRILNSTVSGHENTGNAITFAATGSRLELLHSTIAANSQSGAALLLDAGSALIDHSIIANDADGPDLELEDDASLQVDFSLVENPDASALAALTAGSGNRTGIDPELGPLADNGGPTLTHLPLAGSPAIGAGDPAISGEPDTDQRGFERVIGVIELGAVEVESILPATGVNRSAVFFTGALALGALGFGLGIVLLVGTSRRRGTTPSSSHSSN